MNGAEITMISAVGVLTIAVGVHSKLLLSDAQNRVEQAMADDPGEKREREEPANHHGAANESADRRDGRDVSEADGRDGD